MFVVEKFVNWNPPTAWACRSMADVVPGHKDLPPVFGHKPEAEAHGGLALSTLTLLLKHFHLKCTFKNLSDGGHQPFFFFFLICHHLSLGALSKDHLEGNFSQL